MSGDLILLIIFLIIWILLIKFGSKLGIPT